jgi:diguanylate cyclase (GGDEF)-like protein/PAS domain S-box-containing protein
MQAQLSSDALFRALFDASPDATVVVDDGVILLANAACRSVLGYDPDEVVGCSVEALLPERFKQHPGHRARFSQVPEGRPMGRGKALWARHKDGSEIPVDISLTPMTVSGRKVVGCALRDLRGRANNVEHLRIQATALRSAANGVLITDRNGIIAWANPAACRITGYSAEDLIGHHTRVLKSGSHEESFYRELWSTVTRGETWSGTMVNRRKDGTRYHEEMTIAPVIDDQGAVTHFIAIKQDVSEKHRAEEAISRANAELAERVREIQSLNLQLRDQAISDPLTGLRNRRYLNETIVGEVARVDRTGAPLAVAMVDVDLFKRVNDTHGHPVGDLVLRKLADVLRAHVRSSDLVCRVGGEEFVVVLPDCPLDHLQERAERWRRDFAGATVDPGNGAPVRCTISIGVAIRNAPEPFDATLRRADAALYEAKRAGRDRTVAAA